MKTQSLPTPVLESLEPRLAPAGIVNITVSGGVLTLTGDASANNIEVVDTGYGAWTISGVGTQFTLNGTGAPFSSTTIAVQNSIKASLGGDNDNLQLNGLEMRGTVSVLGGDGKDALSLFQCSTLGAVIFDGGNANDDLSITEGFHGGITFKGGTGLDAVTLVDSTFTKAVSLNFGAGSSAFFVNGNTTLHAGLSTQATGIAGDVHTYEVSNADLIIEGAVSIKATGAGAMSLRLGDFVSDSIHVAGAFAVTGGTGADSVIFSREVMIGGAFSFNASAGSNGISSFDVSLLTLGSFSYTGTTGTDVLSLTSSGGQIAVAKGFTVKAGEGFNSLNVLAPFVTIGGAVSLTAGGGGDSFAIGGDFVSINGALTFKLGNGYNTGTFNPVVGWVGNVSYTGGTAEDLLDIGKFDGTSTAITVLGNITSVMGTGNADLSIRDASVFGSIMHSSNATVTDNFYIRESYVQGKVTGNLLGSAGAYVQVQDSILDMAYSVSTGAGGDEVVLDTVAGTKVSIFRGAVKILLGAGNDIVTAGGTVAAVNRGSFFESTILIDGGADNDITNLQTGYFNSFAFPLQTIGVETVN